jgi:hypothetical protein
MMSAKEVSELHTDDQGSPRLQPVMPYTVTLIVVKIKRILSKIKLAVLTLHVGIIPHVVKISTSMHFITVPA